MNYEKGHTLYFLGIGGIGMSALARYFLARGVHVLGYDRTPSPLTEALEQEGAIIHYEDDPNLLPADITLVVLTPAIPASSKMLAAIRQYGFPLMKRAELLGELSQKHFTIAVAGTHGKTTITAMIAHVLKFAGLKITAFIGGIANNFNSNIVNDSDSAYFVVEADEFDRSFLKLSPDIAVVSSMDADHLDIYGAHEQLIESFTLFAGRISQKGLLIAKNSLEIKAIARRISYGFEADSEVRATDVAVKNGQFNFVLSLPGQLPQQVMMSVAGRHNILNALAAASVAFSIGVDAQLIARALTHFTGVFRRFDIRVNQTHHRYIDDYAHHPEEIKACLSAVRELYGDQKVTAVFQPHLFTRTRDFLHEFAQSLALADEVILLPIYPAREEPIAGVNSEALLAEVPLKSKWLCQKEELIPFINKLKPAVLVTMGAGDIDRFVEPLEKNISAW